MQKNADKPAALRTRLTKRYASKTTSTKCMPLKEVYTMRFSSGKTLLDHVADVALVLTKLSAAGNELDKHLQVIALLVSLNGV